MVPLEPLEPVTADYTVFYEFACMNTCVGGMNRRRLTVVFTLEEKRSVGGLWATDLYPLKDQSLAISMSFVRWMLQSYLNDIELTIAWSKIVCNLLVRLQLIRSVCPRIPVLCQAAISTPTDIRFRTVTCSGPGGRRPPDMQRTPRAPPSPPRRAGDDVD